MFPGRRIPYDRDGTRGFLQNLNTQTTVRELTAAELARLNGEKSVDPLNHAAYEVFTLLFPKPVAIVGRAWSYQYSHASGMISWSPDTTNGLDGRWSFDGSGSMYNWHASRTASLLSSSSPSLWSSPLAATVTSFPTVVGVAFGISGSSTLPHYYLHLYAADSHFTDRLMLVPPTATTLLPPDGLDFGVIRDGDAPTRQFRVHNPTANASGPVTVRLEPTTDNSGVATNVTLSLPGGLAASSVDLPSIAAGGTSDVITMTRAPVAAPYGRSSFRVVIAPTA